MTQEENYLIWSYPNPKEIKSAIIEINSLKFPSHNNMLSLFFKHYWHMVGDQVNAMKLSIQALSSILEELVCAMWSQVHNKYYC